MRDPFLHIKKYKISDMCLPLEKGGYFRLMKNKYWIVTPEDEILCYRGYSWQCNDNEVITNGFLKMYPNCRVEFIENIFVEDLGE